MKRTSSLALICAWFISTAAAASTITVNSTADVAANDGVCTLREAIIAANTNTASGAMPGECAAGAAGLDTIAFNIPGAGVKTITSASDLPTITGPVTIDGSTQPGVSANTNGTTLGSNAVLLINLDMSASRGNGLVVTAGPTTIRGLAINPGSAGIFLDAGSDGSRIEGNFIGTNPAGTAAAKPNSNANAILVFSSNNVIGGTAPAARNLISGTFGGINLGNSGASNNRVEGNLIGTNAAGTAAIPNGNYGVDVTTPGVANVIGGTTAAARNVISGNGVVGVLLQGASNFVQGNYIGVDVTGMAALPNGKQGVNVRFSAPNNLIGGPTAGAGNVISGNGSTSSTGEFNANIDASVDFNVTGTLIQGNFIGTNAAGTGPPTGLPDVLTDGIILASDTTAGGTGAGAGNVIAFNPGVGVLVFRAGQSDPMRASILSNSIHSNGGLGIDLGGAIVSSPGGGINAIGDGVTPNDPCDADTGPNNLQNFPVLTSASSSGGTTIIQGSLNSTANTTFRVELFSSPTCDASGNGEGQTFLGATNVTTDNTCTASINATLPVALTAGQVVTSTATDSANNTSEFSACTAAAVSAPAGQLQFSSATYNVPENGGSATIAVTRSNGTAGTVTVQYATSDGSATAGSDYTAASGTLTFADGETSKTFSVPILDDNLAEGDETVNLALSNPQGGATLGVPATAALTIIDDDGQPAIHFSFATYSVAEDGGSATITVIRSGATGNAVSVSYSTSDGTATAGADYTATSGTLSFASGEISKTFSIAILDDNSFERAETVNLALSNPQGGAALGTPASATLTILDNETRPTLQFSSATYGTNENAGAATITVIRAGATGDAVAVDYTTSDGTATAGQDYTATAGTLQFASGETSKTFTVAILTDNIPEGDESINLTLSNPRGVATLGTPAAATLIIMPSTLGNISTRLRVATGDNALIGGFIITGNQPKKLLLRAIGPSLSLPGKLADPKLDLYDSSNTLIDSNDNWQDAPNKQEIIDSTIAPTNDRESAILRSLTPGAYTAIVRGVNDTTGVGLVEAYDLDRTADSQLSNISTRGLVQTGDNVMIGGFIIAGQTPLNFIVRAIGPSLPLDGKLADPTLELYDGNGTRLRSNDNWKDTQRAEIEATTIPPTNDLESAIVATVSPGAYTAIVRGVNNTSGVALVEIYTLN